MKNFLVLNGPNINMTGAREKDVYGKKTYEEINTYIEASANKLGVQVEFYQSNHEGDIIDALHEAPLKYCGVALNAGAYTHYSYAILDAIAAIDIPVVEVHMSNVHAREDFRHVSLIAKNCIGVIAGFGENSYVLAIEALIKSS